MEEIPDMSVASMKELHSIPPYIRWVFMIVQVESTEECYQLIGGTENDNFVLRLDVKYVHPIKVQLRNDAARWNFINKI